jgi:hypothetical protein
VKYLAAVKVLNSFAGRQKKIYSFIQTEVVDETVHINRERIGNQFHNEVGPATNSTGVEESNDPAVGYSSQQLSLFKQALRPFFSREPTVLRRGDLQSSLKDRVPDVVIHLVDYT